MDILNFSPPKTISYPFFCNPRKTLYPSNRNTPFHKNHFSFYLTSSTSRKFQTLAHFGRPTNRRNSLRNKLLHDHQVRIIHIPNDPSSVSSNHVEDSDVSFQSDGFVELEKQKSELLGENVLLNKLDNWVDQYRKDIDFWGIGSVPIFTVYEDSFGSVKRVLVNEDEILRRVRVQRGGNEIEDKILEAKKLAREMESGNNVIGRKSSVAKFVVEGEEKGGFVKAVSGFIVQPGLVPKISGVGGIVLCVFVVMFGVKKLFRFGDKEVEYTETEKKMMMRKVKARKEKEMLMKGAVEVIHEPKETPEVIAVKKPKLDKEQLKNNILKAKASSDKLVVQNSSGEVRTGSMDMDYKVREIREMARQARESEGGSRSVVSKDMEMDDTVIGKSSNESKVIKENSKQDNSLSNRQNEVARKTTDSNGILHTTSDDIIENVDISIEHEIVRDDREMDKEEIEINENAMTPKDVEDNKSSRTPINGSFMTNKSSVNKKPRIIRSVKEAKDYLSKKHDKENPDTKSGIELGKENMADSKPSEFDVFNDQKQKNLEKNTIVSRSDTLNGLSYSKPDINVNEGSNQKEREKSPIKNECSKDSGTEPGLEDLQKSETALDRQVNGIGSEASLSEEKSFDEVEPTIKQIRNDDASKDSGTEAGLEDLQKSKTALDRQVNGIGSEASLSEEKSFDEVEPTIKQIRNDDTSNMKSDSRPDLNPSEDSDQKDKKFGPTKIGDFKDSGVEPGVANLQNSETTSDHEVNGDSRKTRFSGKTENWLEENFHEVEPIIKQIRAGFRDNYAVAKERVDQPLDLPTEMESLGVGEDGGELDWMQDDHLRDIVFRVRDNELSGREPFYLMNDEDKDAFFRGLEKKVDKENKKLSHLHEWLHSNIENIDYGADGISIYDSPEKIIPRWKGPSVEKIPESLNEFLDKKRKSASTRNLTPVKKDEKDSAKNSADSSSKVKVDGSIAPTKKSKNPKTVVEGSDGSVKAGKKSGKEYWQHTKKWSQEFLDCYNAETDPEVKSVMKDIGKDLDRWITEKEIEEAADLMSKLPERNRSFVEKKINKLKREMELFGPQAVVSKYREYTDDKEEDYLWWLDLPYVLCIEVYKVDDGEQRVGFYSLEMAPDLELEPKPYHVIAFQDPGDCKNLCYIMQAHMDMLGGGNAFVVARPPKEAFRDAKENGFGVTVIKKGELQLNIDQPLEEVEEEITEIGSKMYHDKMTKDRSVDINSIMKGVFGFNGSGNLPLFFEHAAPSSALGMNAMDSRGLARGANLGPLLAASELQNASRLGNHAAGSTHQLPLIDPLYLQYLRSGEVAAAQRNNSITDLLGLQKAYIESLIAQQKTHFSAPYLGKSASMNHNSYGNPSYGPGMSYPGSPLAGSPFPHSMYGQGSPMSQSERNMRFAGMRNVAEGFTGAWHSDAVSSLDENFPSSLLDEFKSNKTKCFELSEIAGHVVEFSADQYGSRFIQQKLETASMDEKTMVFNEIMPKALTLMTDVFGNYVVQKFFEHGTAAQIRELADQLTSHVLTLSLQMYGCRVIQKAIEVVNLDQKTSMVKELDGHIMRCVRDQNGNHVIQKCIECVPEDEIRFIVSTFYDQVVTLSTHPYGCRVIQRVLEYCHDPKTQQIMMDEILQCVSMLAQDQYGNYVVQHVLEHGKPHERTAIIKEFTGQIVQMSQQKFASNVIEKCLSFGTPTERQVLVNEMIGSTDENEPLQVMMKDQFANYVVQKVLETCDDQQLELILNRIKVHLNALKKYTYGKHIVARVEKLVAAGERRISFLTLNHPAQMV